MQDGDRSPRVGKCKACNVCMKRRIERKARHVRSVTYQYGTEIQIVRVEDHI